jgi:hypothetical protein
VHGLIVWGFSFLFLLVIKGNLFEKLLITLLLAIVHCSIDAFMIKYMQFKLKNDKKISQILLFFIDQLIHFIVILIFIYFFIRSIREIQPSVVTILSITNSLIGALKNPYPGMINFLKLLFFVLLALSGGNIVVKKILIDCSILKEEESTKQSKKELSTGQIIGFIERLIIFLLVITNNIAATTWILTAKSIIRFREIKDNSDRYAEYYLIGTLTSSAFAILVGLLFRLFIY